MKRKYGICSTAIHGGCTSVLLSSVRILYTLDFGQINLGRVKMPYICRISCYCIISIKFLEDEAANCLIASGWVTPIHLYFFVIPRFQVLHLNTLQNRDLSKVRPSPTFDSKTRVALLIIYLSKVRPIWIWFFLYILNYNVPSDAWYFIILTIYLTSLDNTIIMMGEGLNS